VITTQTGTSGWQVVTLWFLLSKSLTIDCSVHFSI
jgi:hypothetical protein